VLDSSPAIAFAPSTDLTRSRKFYADVLGLPVEEDGPYACVLRSGGVMIRVTKVDELSPRPYTILGFEVSDIRQAVARLAARGVEFHRFDGMAQDRDGIWTTPAGDMVAWFADPDRNTLSLTQFA
jgi:catechol 2,3-dioxygenase-like lactoylglutathione lyase family enzyme